MKIKYVCKHCSSDNVGRDAFCDWNQQTQEWEISNLMDREICFECSDDTTLVIARIAEPEAVLLALQNLYADYAGYYPSMVNNSPAMKAALDILQTVGESSETDQPSYNPMNRSGNL